MKCVLLALVLLLVILLVVFVVVDVDVDVDVVIFVFEVLLLLFVVVLPEGAIFLGKDGKAFVLVKITTYNKLTKAGNKKIETFTRQKQKNNQPV